MRAIRTIAALLLLLTPLAAQRTDTRFALLGSDISSVPTTLTLRSSDLIGQTQHTFTVTLTDADGQTCAGGFVSMAIQGSYDNSTWITIGEPLSNIQVDQYGAYTGVARADAAYPRIRFVVTAFDTTNCVAAVGYSGTLAPTSKPSPTLLYPIYTIPAGTTNDTASSPVAVAGLNAHMAYVDFKGCTNGLLSATLQGAWESAGPWHNIGYSSITAHNATITLNRWPRAWGEYPLVRLLIDQAVNTDCTTAQVYYWGSRAAPDPRHIGGDGTILTIPITRTSAGTTELLVGSSDYYHDLLSLLLIVPCSGVSATLEFSGSNIIDAQDGPFTIAWPNTGHPHTGAQWLSGIGSDSSFTTAGTGCDATIVMTVRTTQVE